ncbi:hypothetical protein BDQ17DRAFT_1392429 [Cyathus striatus]|nr:hypothetical protein BDQ17DRAFT_1392429 [Cyathus striatus]
MITRFAIVTLIFFFISTILVIYPVSFEVPIPYIGRKRVTIGLTTAPIITIAILWASQCLGGTQIRNGIVGTDGIKPYNILILFISLAYMAITLDVTGILEAAAFWVSNKGGSRGRRLYLYFYLLLTGISMIVGNDPVILTGTLFLVYYTAAAGLNPVPWLMAEFAAANTASMVLFLGNPTNVVICEGFSINNAAFTAYTIFPFLACSLSCYIALMVQFRDKKHVPRTLDNVQELDPRKPLKDIMGACVGGIMLITCLIVVLVLSFFRVDVWKIVLPFAVAKFVFDICWDHYRFKNNMMPAVIEGQDAAVDELSRMASMSGDIERTVTFNSIVHNSIPVDSAKPANVLNKQSITTSESDSPNSSRSTTVVMHDTPVKISSNATVVAQDVPAQESSSQGFLGSIKASYDVKYTSLATHFPTFFTAFPRLPFGLIPFAFSQFILIEALTHQGWIDVFGRWLVHATHGNMYSTIWIVGILGVILCNIAGTNIGATIFLTKIIHAADLPGPTTRAAAISLAVASNIGAVSFTFSASLAGLLWDNILRQKNITKINQWTFAKWNILPITVMTSVGLAVVCAEMTVLY